MDLLQYKIKEKSKKIRSVDFHLTTTSLFKPFLIKENKIEFKKGREGERRAKDIMPKYKPINLTIRKDNSEIRSFYNIKGSIFKEMTNKNSLIYNTFFKLFKKSFFGPSGYVTEKFNLLKKFYEDKLYKSGLDTKIYAGMLVYYDMNKSYGLYERRLNNSKQKILSMSQNFAIANFLQDKVDKKALFSKYKHHNFSFENNKYQFLSPINRPKKNKFIKHNDTSNSYSKMKTSKKIKLHTEEDKNKEIIKLKKPHKINKSIDDILNEIMNEQNLFKLKANKKHKKTSE